MAGYTVDEAETFMHDNLRAMRAEYTKMRDIAQKRIGRMARSEFKSSETFLRHAGGFQKLKDIPKEDLPKAFSELSKFLASKRSSISGQREIRNKTIQSWNAQGLPLNQSNYDRTMKILERMRQLKIVYDSETAVELAKLTLDLSDQKFDQVLNNLEAYLTHLDELSGFLDSERDPQTGFERVDMSDFTDMIGW